LGIFLHFVPASTTGWLQPLDVAVFAKFKGWVVREVERQRLVAPSGLLSRKQVLATYVRGVSEVLQAHNWTRSFELTGLRGQDRISKRLMARMRMAAPPVLSDALPLLSAFKLVFPANRDVPVEELFEVLMAKVRQATLLRLPVRAKLPRAPGFG
jgi:hypothetical protein